LSNAILFTLFRPSQSAVASGFASLPNVGREIKKFEEAGSTKIKTVTSVF